jgi:hypothetical protein
MWNGIGIGIGRSSFAGSFAGSYSKRVLADGGTIEALSCVAGVSSILKRASLLLIPSGYKAGVAYSALPRNGNGDLSWTRSSSATRLDSNGEIESMVSGVPRLDYSYGSCPSILLEPQRTNLIINSILSGSPSPTSWTLFSTGTYTQQASSLGNDSSAYYLTTVSQRSYFQSSNSISVSANTKYVFSVYVEELVGSVSYNNVAALVSTPIGSTTTYYQDGVLVSNPNSNASVGRISIVFSVSATAGSCLPRFGIGVSGDSTGEIKISRPQFETGAYSTSYIPTTTATVTRIEDLFVRNNIYTNGLITSSGGTWFIELKNNIQYTADSNTSGTFISNVPAGAGSGSNSINLRNPLSSNRLLINKIVNNSVDTIYQTNADNVKLAIKWNGSIIEVFANGSKVVSNSSFTPTNMEYLSSDARDQPRYIQKMALYKTPLSDSDCIALTT